MSTPITVSASPISVTSAITCRARPLRVLAHIHTFNDADIIARTIWGVRRHTYRVDEILLVDNASSDGTLEQPAVSHATVLRQAANGGTSGAVHSGFRYALDHG